MKVKFIPSEEFMRQFKRLAKKYPSLVSDYDTFKKELIFMTTPLMTKKHVCSSAWLTVRCSNNTLKNCPVGFIR